MYGILHYIIGYIGVRISGSGAIGAINALKDGGFKFWRVRPIEGGYSFNCSVFEADKTEAKLKALGCDYSVSAKKGVPFALFRYRKRPGLLVGLLAALLIVYLSTTVVWEVRVECGGDDRDLSQARTALARLGVRSGAPVRSINAAGVELRFLVDNPRFSDVAVNIQGTVAVVKLRLRTKAPRPEAKTGAYDVVAAEAGVVREINAAAGVPAVKRGDTVDKGDLLISGAMKGAYGEYYLHHACGSVKATVYREYTVAVPLEREVRTYTGESVTKTSYTVLGRRFDVFLNERSPYERCDAETDTKGVSFLGAKLPIVKETLMYKEYTTRLETVSEDEAKREAEEAFAAYLERETEGEIVNTECEYAFDKARNAVLFKGTAELIAEIGVETKMQTLPQPEKAAPACSCASAFKEF